MGPWRVPQSPDCCPPCAGNTVRVEPDSAGHDEGAANWACIASLIETAKLHGIDPQAYLADVLTKLVNLWPEASLDELMPWAWGAEYNTQHRAAA